jgi:hypothetical protein
VPLIVTKVFNVPMVGVKEDINKGGWKFAILIAVSLLTPSFTISFTVSTSLFMLCV